MSDVLENLEDREDEGGRKPAPSQRPSSSGNYFTVYRPHQGGWTRLGTAIGSVLFIAATAMFLAYEVSTAAKWSTKVTAIVVLVWVIGSSVLAWWAQNKPLHVEFLIDTDSEMKKVNWTSRKELIGSTKIVILFMFVMSLMLFVIDLLFQFFFHSIGVLKFSPFSSVGK